MEKTYNEKQVEKALEIACMYLTAIIDGEKCVKMIQEDLEDEDLQKIVAGHITAAIKVVEIRSLLEQAAAN